MLRWPLVFLLSFGATLSSSAQQASPADASLDECFG